MTDDSVAGPVLSDLAAEETLVAALRKRDGRATLGDLSVDTGMPRASVQEHLGRLLSIYESHLAVDEEGELVYEFDRKFVRRDTGDGLQRGVRKLGLWAWNAFKFLFKIVIMATLVFYVLFFAVLLIAAMVAMASGGSSSSSDSRRGPIAPIFWIGRIFYVPQQRHYGPRQGLRAGATAKKSEPLYKKIFAFVFGPDAANDVVVDPFGGEKRVLDFIRHQKGVITAADLAGHTGWTRQRADSELAGLMFRHEGDVRVTKNGTLLYTFGGVARTADAGRRVSMARPAWESFEGKKPLTGNTPGTNFAIAAFNGFNLIMSFFGGSLLSYVLEAPIPLWGHFAVGVFPFLFSLVFFAVPLMRLLAIVKENASRAVRNSARFVQREIYETAKRDAEVTALDIVDSVARRWPKNAPGKARAVRIERQVDEAVLDYDADVVSSSETGGTKYRFSALTTELREAERARALVQERDLRVGKIVFSSADDDLGLDQLDDFDRQLGVEPRQYSAEELAQLSPDLEQFDEELARAVETEAATVGQKKGN
jgi:hypothetical protein